MKGIHFFLIVILLATIASCDKTNDTYSIKGRMIKDCSGAPFASYSLRLWRKAANSAGQSRDLGTATTDADGNFTIDNIPYGSKVGLYLYHDVDANSLISWCDAFEARITNPGDTYDLGTFYGSREKTAILKLNINLPAAGPNDSLYVGTPGNYKVVHPIPNSTVLVFNGSLNVPSRIPVDYQDTYPVYWGINKSGVDNAFNTGSHILRPVAGVCQNPDTSSFTIQ